MVSDRHTIHFCLTGDRFVFLDIRRNRYFTLSSRLGASFAAIAKEGQSQGTITSEGLAALTLGDTEAAKAEVAFSRAATPAREDRVARQSALGVTGRSIASALMSRDCARLLLRFAPFRLVIPSSVTVAEPGLTAAQLDGVDAIAAAFRQMGMRFGLTGMCLPHTLAFIWMCRLAGYRPSLVIGVRVNPFQAHCWSQDGAQVLNDTIDNVRAYQPILMR